jgi:hypothetical protein
MNTKRGANAANITPGQTDGERSVPSGSMHGWPAGLWMAVALYVVPFAD